MSFLALDFETADYGRDSACALGLVRVEDGAIVRRASYLIRPPRRDFVFTYIHGITWDHVKRARTFGDLWPDIRGHFQDVDFLVAHNAGFDREVLHACCRRAGLAAPDVPFKCTMVLSRRLWGIYPTTLPDVCRRFRIPISHHDAVSDAEACARIMIHAMKGSVPWIT
jgi:DNA polymerase-3 subunit epsilon